MERSDQDRFGGLLETELKEHTIHAMREWCNASNSAGMNNAALVVEEISSPLWAWVSKEQGRRGKGNYSDINAAIKFAVAADDIARRLKHLLGLYPEHVNLLEISWGDFLREFSASSYWFQRKITDGGKLGYKVQFGTEAEKKEERGDWQRWIDDACAEKPTWSFEAIKAKVVQEHPLDVSLHQLKRYTKDPRKR